MLAYIDDIRIPTDNVEEYLIILERVLELILKARLKLKLKKCAFFRRALNV